MEQIYVFTAANQAAQRNLPASITSALPRAQVVERFAENERAQIEVIANEDDLYAWGTTPGP